MTKAVMPGPTHLVIPDAHAKPDQDFRRFKWLGEIIMDRRPDKIICIGDFADMHSLSSYDRGTRGFEGRRYHRDCEAAHEAMALMMSPMLAYNARQRRNKGKQYKPELHLTLGNHENRINRATNAQPELHGTLSVNDLGYEKFGWTVHDFLKEVEIDGVTYSHFFVSGVMAKPIGGEHPATMLLNKRHKSCTAGHLHLADWSQRTVAGGKHIMGCMCGCYLEEDEEYVPRSVNEMWWKGLLFKHNVVDGVYDPEFLSLNSIKREFGIAEGE